MSEAVSIDILLKSYGRLQSTGAVCSNDIRTLSAAVEDIREFVKLNPPETFTHMPSRLNHDIACENILRSAFNLLIKMVKAIFNFIKNSLIYIGTRIRDLFLLKEKVAVVADTTEKLDALVKAVQRHLNIDYDAILDQKAVTIIKEGLAEISEKELAAINSNWNKLDEYLLLNVNVSGSSKDDLVVGLSETFKNVLEFVNLTVGRITTLSESMHSSRSFNTTTIDDMWGLSSRQLTLEPSPRLLTVINGYNPRWRDPNATTLIGAAVNVVDKFILDLSTEKVSGIEYSSYLIGISKIRDVVEKLEMNITIKDLAKIQDTLEQNGKTLVRGLENLQTTNEAELIAKYKTMVHRTEDLSKALTTMFNLQKSIVSSLMNTVHSASSFNKQKLSLCDDAIRLRGLSDAAKAEILALRKAL